MTARTTARTGVHLARCPAPCRRLARLVRLNHRRGSEKLAIRAPGTMKLGRVQRRGSSEPPSSAVQGERRPCDRWSSMAGEARTPQASTVAMCLSCGSAGKNPWAFGSASAGSVNLAGSWMIENGSLVHPRTIRSARRPATALAEWQHTTNASERCSFTELRRPHRLRNHESEAGARQPCRYRLTSSVSGGPSPTPPAHAGQR